jgi:hypothetical protein
MGTTAPGHIALFAASAAAIPSRLLSSLCINSLAFAPLKVKPLESNNFALILHETTQMIDFHDA